MKSIKEKSEEYSFIGQGIDPAGIQFREFNTNKHDGFKAGANYVLDEIEEVINHPRRFVTGDKTIEEGMIEEISKLVEQLKEK